MIDVPFDYGYAVIDRSGAVRVQYGDVGRVFPLASVTKLITALGVHVAIQRELMSYDQAAGPPQATIAHVLAHASGLSPEGDGTQTAARVGARRIYSNQGYEVLGYEIEAATGCSASQWLRREVSEPLGMVSVEVNGSPAHCGQGNVADLSILAQEFLDPQLLDSTTAQAMHTPAFPDLVGILPGYGRQDPNLWGLGPEIRGNKTDHWTPPTVSAQTFGHFGQSGSFVWADPMSGLAGVFLGEEPFGPWHKKNWPALPLE